MKNITIDGVEYIPVIKQEITTFEIYPNDLGEIDWHKANQSCEKLGDRWRLPNKEELNQLYQNKDELGGFVDGGYWSSNNFASSYAWCQHFHNGGQNFNYKFTKYNIRLVRDIKIK